MNGPQIFRWATQMMARAAEDVIHTSGLKPDQIDLFIPHQANLRIIEATAKRLGLPADRVFANVERYGNTSAASIPIALCEALATGRIDSGDNIVLTSFGAGLSWAALALRWGVPDRRKAVSLDTHSHGIRDTVSPRCAPLCAGSSGTFARRSTNGSAGTATSARGRPRGPSARPTCARTDKSFACSAARALQAASPAQSTCSCRVTGSAVSMTAV